MKILVTGGTGVLGYHLLNALLDSDARLYSFSDRPPEPYRMVSKVQYCYGNILRPEEVKDIIEELKPDEIFHIASQSSIRIGHSKPIETLTTNIVGSYNLLDAVRQIVPSSRVLMVSSSEVYGRGEGLLDVLHEENNPPNPLSPFATSKACMELLARQFINSRDLDIVTCRPFYFIGPHHSRRFVLPQIAEQLVRIQKYSGEPVLYTGNLDISRDILDIRDLARAILLLMRNGKTGETYNICSGQARTLREMTETLIRCSGLDVEIRTDMSSENMQSIPMLMGSPEKIRQDTGWRPLIAVEDSLADLYHEMHERIAREERQQS